MIEKGSYVEILNDQDGATSMIGFVREVYSSGNCCVALPVGGFRNFKQSQLRKIMETEVKTENVMNWKFETDIFNGICVIAMDAMEIRFLFESVSDKFYDVLKIQSAIQTKLNDPVSVEGMAQWCFDQWPNLKTTVSGRAASHGWITATVND